MKFIYNLIIIILLLFVISSCENFVEIDPPVTKADESVVFNNNSTAIAVINRLYGSLSNNGFGSGAEGVSILAGLSADELIASFPSRSIINEAFSNSLSSLDAPYWSILYNLLYSTNATIEGVSASSTLNPKVKLQLLGEAKFMRAFLHFYLVNLFGDIPIITTTDYRVTSKIPRMAQSLVYEQIIADLKDAQTQLSSDYLANDLVTVTDERVRPTKMAATTLLARVYLYIGDWNNAALQATELISKKTEYDLVSLNDVFLKNSKEAIWQLQPISQLRYNTQDAKAFIIVEGPNWDQPVALSDWLLNSFDVKDKRLTNWISSKKNNGNTYYFPLKYKVGEQNAPITEYLMVFRLAELYLIRAEARTQLNNITAAQDDLNVIRTRAGLANTDANDKSSMLMAIERERQAELFTEWGHRWFDLKRTSRVEQVMSVITPKKGGVWNPNWKLYPIPLESAIQRSAVLFQNPGYQ